MKKGDTPPDISYTTMVGNSGWVQEGESTYYLVNLVSGETLELEIRCKKRTSASEEKHLNATLLNVCGHRGTVKRHTIQAGLFKRRPMQQLKLEVSCDVTNRVLEISITAEPGSTALDQVAQLLGLYKCH